MYKSSRVSRSTKLAPYTSAVLYQSLVVRGGALIGPPRRVPDVARSRLTTALLDAADSRGVNWLMQWEQDTTR